MTSFGASNSARPLRPSPTRWSTAPALPCVTTSNGSGNLGLSAGAASPDGAQHRHQCGICTEYDAGPRAAGSGAHKPLVTGAHRSNSLAICVFPKHAGTLTPHEDSGKTALVHARCSVEMARALGWGEVAPFYINLESPQPASRNTKAGRAACAAEGRSSAVRHHLVWWGSPHGGRICRLVARKTHPCRVSTG